MSSKVVDLEKRQKNDVLFREQRAHPRYTSDVEVEFSISGSTPHTFYAGFTEDISMGGVFLATQQIYPVGSEITLNFDVLTQKLSLKAVVRWIKEADIFEGSDVAPGMGLQFIALSEKEKEIIEIFLKQRAPMFVDVD